MDNSDLIQVEDECPDCHGLLYLKVDDKNQRIDFVCVKKTCDRNKAAIQKANTKMEFCPVCRHMLRAEEGPDRQLKVKCTRKGCEYQGNAVNMLVHNRNLKKVTEEAAINWRDMPLDKTLQRAYGGNCRKPDCYNNETLLFQIQSPNGVESYAICTQCKYHWPTHLKSS